MAFYIAEQVDVTSTECIALAHARACASTPIVVGFHPTLLYLSPSGTFAASDRWADMGRQRQCLSYSERRG
jgi:hypothetical protein